MEYKNKVANFIAYHNIIRPIEYPLFVLPFFSGGYFVGYLIFFFLSPNIHVAERIVCILGIVLSIFACIFGLNLRKKYLNLFDTEPGKSLYFVEMWKYIYIGFNLFFLTFYCLLLVKNNEDTFMMVGVILLVIIISAFMTAIVVKIRIKKDMYNGRKCIDSRIVAFFASGTCFAILMVIKNIVTSTAEANGPFIIFFIMFAGAESCTILAIIYYLKLKYAKKYGLEEYFPTRPNPSPYTNWE